MIAESFPSLLVRSDKDSTGGSLVGRFHTFAQSSNNDNNSHKIVPFHSPIQYFCPWKLNFFCRVIDSYFFLAVGLLQHDERISPRVRRERRRSRRRCCHRRHRDAMVRIRNTWNDRGEMQLIDPRGRYIRSQNKELTETTCASVSRQRVQPSNDDDPL